MLSTLLYKAPARPAIRDGLDHPGAEFVFTPQKHAASFDRDLVVAGLHF